MPPGVVSRAVSIARRSSRCGGRDVVQLACDSRAFPAGGAFEQITGGGLPSGSGDPRLGAHWVLRPSSLLRGMRCSAAAPLSYAKDGSRARPQDGL
jgi:hypothetical protein